MIRSYHTLTRVGDELVAAVLGQATVAMNFPAIASAVSVSVRPTSESADMPIVFTRLLGQGETDLTGN